MASRAFALDVPAANASGAALDVARFRNLTAQVQGTGWVASLQLEGRLRGGAWEALGGALTAANIGDLVGITDNVEELRVTTSGFTSGTPAIRLHVDLPDGS